MVCLMMVVLVVSDCCSGGYDGIGGDCFHCDIIFKQEVDIL